MANSKRDSILVDIQKSLVQLQQVIGASLRPLPTETGDGTYITHTTPTGLINDLPHVKPKDVETLIDVAKAATTGDPQNDRDYIMERVIQVRDRPSWEGEQAFLLSMSAGCRSPHLVAQWPGSD